MARARKLIEEEFGQKASVEDLITLFEGAARPGGKTFHRRHVYRLLRMAEMDEKVLEEAQIVPITPKPLYAPLFARDRKERFAGNSGVIWLPRQDSNLQPSG